MTKQKGVQNNNMPLTQRQRLIAELVEKNEPITGDKIAQNLHVTRAALRSDLAILTTSGILEARTKVGYFYTGKKTLGLFAEDVKNICVKDVKSLPVAVDESANAYDALVTMFTEDVGSVFIVAKKDILSGVVSRKDLIKATLTGGGELSKIPVRMVMTPLTKLVMTHDDESIILAARKIIENEVDSLPVVQEIEGLKKKYKITGRFTKTNLARVLVDLTEEKGSVYHN